ncbi:hypothetical protein Vadar_001842 [Vaccinium darrowii]|uniref:Uncharacterized protein n=1 Tax=Vaccinium darrowii TaxID=229202 RepID=A0ACB7YSS8_9ERIC|nr:hypothetical protein Vadar_001842 [Vaccinium darrowii]
MVKNMGIIVCLLIMVMDIAAGILGIEAEMAQNKDCSSTCILNVDCWGTNKFKVKKIL